LVEFYLFTVRYYSEADSGINIYIYIILVAVICDEKRF